MSASRETATPAIVALQVLLGNHLKALKLPKFVREYEKVAMSISRTQRLRVDCFKCNASAARRRLRWSAAAIT